MFTRQKSQIDIKKSTQKLLDSKKEIGARIKHLKLILDTVDVEEAKCIFATHYSHIYHLVYEGIVSSETKMRGPAHQKQREREELESVLQILEKIMLLLPDLLQCRWQLHSLSRLFGRLAHPHNSIRLRREAIRLFILWYTALNTSAPRSVDEMFTEIVKNHLPEKYPEQIIGPLEIMGINQEKYSSDTESVEYLLECLLDFMVTESSKHSWNNPLPFNTFYFLYEKFKSFYLDKLFPDFYVTYDLYSELPIELPDLRQMSTDKTELSKASCQVVFIKWIANYTHSVYKTWNATNQKQNLSFDKSASTNNKELDENVRAKNVILGSQPNINLVHEVFRRALLMNFVQSAVIRRVICVYKDWIQMNVPELPVFMLEPDGSAEDLKAGSQKILRLFFVNSSSVFLLFGIPNDALLEEQVDICKRVLNIYRYAVMNTRMDSQTWEQLLVVMLNVTSKVLNPKANNILGSKLSSALFQTLIVSWVKASLNVRIPLELWDELQSVLAILTFSDNLVTEWAKTMETLTRVLSRHVYNLDLSNLPLDRLTEQKAKKNRGKKQSHGGGEGIIMTQSDDTSSNQIKKEPRGKPLKKLKRSLSEGNVEQAVKDERHTQLKRARSVDMEMHHSSTDISSIVSLETNHNNLIDASLPDQAMISSEVEGDHADAKDHDEQVGRGVIEGGHVKGWLPSVASILWRRMLGILGDVNLIPYPHTHLHFFQVLTDIWNTLFKIRKNLGVSLDNLSTPKPPELTPPLQLISPWCFQILDLPREFSGSKLLAVSLLCDITLEDTPMLGQDYMTKFYGMVHRIITSSEGQELKNELVKKMGQKMMGKMLPGFTLLLSDLVQCSLSILGTADLGKTPRMDAATLLANILFVSKVTIDLPVLNPDQSKFQPVSSQQQQTQEMSLLNLIKCSKLEPTSHARAITLQALTIYACGLLEQMRLGQSQSNSNGINSEMGSSLKFSDSQRNLLDSIVQSLVASVNVENRNICLVCSDLLLCLSEYAVEIRTHLSHLESEIILGLKTSMVNTLENTGGGGRPFEKRLLLSLILTLGEWCMSIPISAMSHNKCSEYKLVSFVFEALLTVIKSKSGGGSGTGVGRNYSSKVKDFNPSVPFDDLQQHDTFSWSGVKSSLGKDSVFIKQETKVEQRSSLKMDVDVVQLAATNLLYHLETQLGHFPINVSSRCCSVVSENNDSIYEGDELNSVIFTLPNLQMFALDNNRILSVIELENEENLDKSYVRFIIRDLSGKSCWDVSTLEFPNTAPLPLQPSWNPYNVIIPEDNNFATSSFNPLSNGPRLTVRKRASGSLPTELDSAHDLDNLDDLLSYIKYTSPECCLSDIEAGMEESEEDVVSLLVSQRNTELQHLNSAVFPTLSQHHQNSIKSHDTNNTFRNSGRLLSQIGFNAWDKRGTVHLLDKDEKLLRELKHLDTQRCREAHKIAVIYVARGQEDKHSILGNTGGSEDYEDFVSGLGWEVELDSHTGFMGGLQRNKSSGETAPYFATSFTEVIFHVSTRMPGHNPDDLLQKTRHLGNDEVHIIWSEHNRDYRRDIIPTEFADVLIVIYPLEFSLYRVTINRKSEVPYSGPLYHEAILEKPILAHLVRCTAVNASRAKRSSLPYFQNYFEERQKSLETIMSNHRIRSTFETFASSLYRPLNPGYLEFQSGCCSRASGTSFTSTNTNKTMNSQQLAALIDSNLHNPNFAHVHSAHSHEYHESSSSVPPSPTPPVPPKRLSIKLGHGLKPKMQTPPVSPSTIRR